MVRLTPNNPILGGESMTTKRGAGSTIDHYIQDCAEIYLAARLQEEAEKHGVAISHCSAAQEGQWTEYATNRNVLSKFLGSKYKKNVDATVADLTLDIIKKYPGRKFYFTCVDAEFRNKNLKGDLLITFDNCEQISISVKNYKNGYDSLQVCSGTFNSTLVNFLFENTNCTPGTYIGTDNKKFKGSKRSVRDRYVKEIAPQLLPFFWELDTINDDIRSFYINSHEAEHWENVSTKWKEDCTSIGTQVATTIKEALTQIDNKLVLKRLLKQTGIVGDEHLLCIGKGEYLLSLTNEKYETLKNRLAHANHVDIRVSGQSLFYDICDLDGIILTINQPCTLQKNGAWHALNEDKFDGLREKNDKGKKVLLKWGQRRPAKSKELATSTNTYLRIKQAL